MGFCTDSKTELEMFLWDDWFVVYRLLWELYRASLKTYKMNEKGKKEIEVSK